MPSPQTRIAISKSPIMISQCKNPIEALENMKSMPLTAKSKKLSHYICVSNTSEIVDSNQCQQKLANSFPNEHATRIASIQSAWSLCLKPKLWTEFV